MHSKSYTTQKSYNTNPDYQSLRIAVSQKIQIYNTEEKNYNARNTATWDTKTYVNNGNKRADPLGLQNATIIFSNATNNSVEFKSSNFEH